MTTPASVFSQTRVRKANWLGRYLTVEHKHDEELVRVLQDAAKDTRKLLAALPDNDNATNRVRRLHYNNALREIRSTLKDTFGKTGNIIRAGQKDAAEAAVEAQLFEDARFLGRIFTNPVDRQQYSDSLKQTARRQIEATITRVLKTEQPLSRRVYKSRALANGMVSRIVNRGLSRGDSAADIARAVSGLIRPDTPGGVSYAAKRLARTEINNAFHAQSIHDIQEIPWLNQAEWHLSKVHEFDHGDMCEVYAVTKYFPSSQIPPKPHPQCRCYVTGVALEYEEFENALIAGEYNDYIDERMGIGHTVVNVRVDEVSNR